MVEHNRVIIKPDGRSPKKVKFKSGIYEIVHTPSNRRYVGSSFQVEKRLYLHQVQLRRDTHHCRYLQNVWNKYGAEEFEFYLVCECAQKDLIIKEQEVIDSTDKRLLLNTHPIAGGAYGYKHSDDVKSRMSVSAKKIAASSEERLRRSDRAKKQHATGNFGQNTWPKEVIDRMRSKPHVKTKATLEVIERIHNLRNSTTPPMDQYTIAEIVGVSQGTVSKVLRNYNNKYERARLGDGHMKRRYSGR